MAQYEKVFTKPYEDGYVDLPNQTTPITAETLNDKDAAIEHIENFLDGQEFPTELADLSDDETHRLVTDTEKTTWNNKADISSIGTDESGRTTASKAYAIGEHFYKDGKFCTAKTAIASGATFTLNTNYIESDLSETLKNKANTTITATTNDYYSLVNNDIYMKNGMTIMSVLVKADSARGEYTEVGRIPSEFDVPLISVQGTSVSYDGGYSNAPLNYVLGPDRRLLVRGGVTNCRYPIYITY